MPVNFINLQEIKLSINPELYKMCNKVACGVLDFVVFFYLAASDSKFRKAFTHFLFKFSHYNWISFGIVDTYRFSLFIN